MKNDMRAGRCFVVAFLAALLAGCGGSGGQASTLDGSRSCLSGLGTTTPGSDLDYIAERAGGGAIGVRVSGQMVTVVFENTDADAKRTEAAYRLFGEAFDTPVDDILSRHGNVVILWERTPSDEDAERVSGCL